MATNRREFVTMAALATTATAAAGCLGATRSATAPTADGSLESWAAFRKLFRLRDDRIHMAALLLASHPRPVREAIDEFRRELDEDPSGAWHRHRFERDIDGRARLAAAGYMGGSADQIALTDSTTMGLGLLYSGLDLNEGDEILSTLHEHYSTEESLRLNSLRTGASVTRIPLYRDAATATREEMVESISDAIRENTRVVAITWVHSGTGVKVPVRLIADAVALHNAKRAPEKRILLCVDGVHGFGVESARVAELGCDFFAAGCHKWLFGPRGTGVLWGKTDAWPSVKPSIPPFESPIFRAWLRGEMHSASPALSVTPGGFHSFEHRWALPTAFKLHADLGPERVERRIHELNTRAKRGLSSMSHVRLHTPMSEAVSSGITCFEVEGMQPVEVVRRLGADKIIASTTPYRRSLGRITPGLCNSESDVDRTLEAIARLRA